MSKRNRKPMKTATLLALSIGGILTSATGCGSANVSATGPGPGGASFAEGTPINYEHEATDNRPSLNLGTYRYVPAGNGLSPNVGLVSNLDSDVDYNLALRTASLKLRGDLPTMAEIRRLQTAVKAGLNNGTESDPAFVYGDIIHYMIFGPKDANGNYASPPEFKRQMVTFWHNMMKMGGSLTALSGTSATATSTVSLDTAPNFAAMLSVTDADMRGLFTQNSMTCPTFNPATATFTPGSCAATNNVPDGMQAGVLTDPGFMAQYYSNFGFRRTRQIQEIFACSPLPAEFAPAPVQEGQFLYSSSWPFNSVANAATGYKPVFDFVNVPRMVRGTPTAPAVTTTTSTDFVDFRADCQNCHSTQNHRAPLFGVFDQVGFRSPTNQLLVTSATSGSPFAQIQEYLNQCNPDPAHPVANAVCKGAITWKYGLPGIDFGGTAVPNFNAFGQQMAGDDQTAKCMMIRLWNNAYSRDDVVDQLALVPDSVIDGLTSYFKSNNYNLKMAMYKLYTDANFIRF